MAIASIESAGFDKPIVSSEALVNPDKKIRKLKRTVTKTLAALSIFAATNTGLETYYMHERPTQTKTEYKNFTSNLEAMIYFPHTYWVVFPGAGVDFAASVESQLAPLMHEYGQTFTVEPSPVKIDPSEIASSIAARVNPDNINKDETIHLRLYGISMGGMLAWEVGKKLEQRYPNIVIDAVIFDSSPASTSDVSQTSQQFVKASAMVDSLSDLPLGIPNPLKGGPIDRFLFNTAETASARIKSHQMPFSPDDLSQSWRLSTGVASNYLAEQMKIINTFDTSPDPHSLKDAKFAYFGAGEGSIDSVVAVDRAIDGYQRLIGSERNLDVYRMSGTSHASADRTPKPYMRSLAEFIVKSGFASKEDINNTLTKPGSDKLWYRGI